MDTEVGLFKDSSVKPPSTFGNHRPDGHMKMWLNVSLLPKQRGYFKTSAYLFLKLAFMSSMPVLGKLREAC